MQATCSNLTTAVRRGDNKGSCDAGSSGHRGNLRRARSRAVIFREARVSTLRSGLAPQTDRQGLSPMHGFRTCRNVGKTVTPGCQG